MPVVTKKVVTISLTSENRRKAQQQKKSRGADSSGFLRQAHGHSSRAGKLNASKSLHARKITRRMESGSVISERSLAGQLLAIGVLMLCGTQSHYTSLLFTQILHLSSCFHPSTLEVLLETWALLKFRPLLLPEPRKQSPLARSAHRVVLG